MERIKKIAFVLLVAAVLYACFLCGLRNLGLVGPDEPRYAEVAREMAASGDMVTPRLYGRPWFEKPALYYWRASAAFRLLGINELAARLPSALGATLLTLVLGWAAKRSYGRDAGCAVLLLFPTCVGVIGFARAATPDMLFTTFLGLTMIFAGVLVGFPVGSRPQRFWLLLFGATLGMATLAKGPAAMVLAGGSVGLWAIVTRKWKEAFRLAYPSAIITFLVVALPWYVVCAWRNPDFVRTFLVAHNVDRYLTSVFQHEQPFWFFGPILLLGLLPWSVLLAGVVRDAVRAMRERALRNSAGFFLGCWVLFPLVFFSFSKSKLPGYILPVFPALAILLARSITRKSDTDKRMPSWLLAGSGATFLLLAATATQWLKRLPPESGLQEAKDIWPWLAAAALGGILAAALALLRRQGASLLVSAVLMAGLVGMVAWRILPRLDPHLSARAAAAAVAEAMTNDEPIYVFRLHRAWHYGLNFYLQEEIITWNPDYSKPGLRPGLVCTSREGLAELRRLAVPLSVLRDISRQAVVVRIHPDPRRPSMY